MLNDPEIADTFEVTTGGKLAALNLLEDNINPMTEKMKDMILMSAAEIFGKRRKKNVNKPWLMNAILALCDTRQELKKMKEDPEVACQYSNVTRSI